jgi:uridine kinase
MHVIGIAGGDESGKITVVKEIRQQLPDDEVVIFPKGSYYRDNRHLI